MNESHSKGEVPGRVRGKERLTKSLASELGLNQ